MGRMWTCARWKHSRLRHNSSLLLFLWSRRLVRVQHLVDWRCSDTRQTDCRASVKLLMSFCEAHSTCFAVELVLQQFVAFGDRIPLSVSDRVRCPVLCSVDGEIV